MAGLLVAAAIGIILPIALFMRALVKKQWVPFLLGVLAFTVSQMLIRIPLLNYLTVHSSGYMMWSALHPILFSSFLALTAALAEELARYTAIRYLMTTRTWLSGVFFGAGHGGVEAVFLLGIPVVSLLASSPHIAEEAMYFVGAAERFFVILLHIGLSLLVLQAVRKRQVLFLIAAIGIHTLVDALVGILPVFVPPSWQLLIIESFIAVSSVVLLVYTFYLKKKG